VHVTAFDKSHDTLFATFGADAAVACFAGDVLNPEDCVAAVDLAASLSGRLNGIIHCAAIHSSTVWSELRLDELQRVMAVNVGGAFLIAQAGAMHMMARGGGAIVLTSSSNVIAGGVGGKAGMGGPAYVTSKSAIVGLVRSLARSLGPHGINVNGIMPGVTDTPMIAGYSPEHRANQSLLSPLGRIAEPADIAEVSCFLVSKGARYMTGETVIVNGGAHFG
jgi:3-oxoacyl-[acyl-carrier protein] reductase